MGWNKPGLSEECRLHDTWGAERECYSGQRGKSSRSKYLLAPSLSLQKSPFATTGAACFQLPAGLRGVQSLNNKLCCNHTLSSFLLGPEEWLAQPAPVLENSPELCSSVPVLQQFLSCQVEVFSELFHAVLAPVHGSLWQMCKYFTVIEASEWV